jgi:hypothetical protein
VTVILDDDTPSEFDFNCSKINFLTMQKLVNNIHFNAQDRADYRKTGIVALRRLFEPNIIERLRRSVDGNFRQEDQPAGVLASFDRYSNEFANRDELFRELVEQLLPVINSLCEEDLGVTMIAILEIEAGKSKGFTWHFDNYSFAFIDPDVSAHTLWLPLNPIDVTKQHGGMFWVHQNDFSGMTRMQQWAHYQCVDKKHQMPDGKYAKAHWAQYPFEWVGPYDNLMMEDLKRDCSLEEGDALLFQRYTWHRSQELSPNGPLKKRTTIIFRLVDLDGRINRTLFQRTIERMLLEGSTLPKSFGDRLEGFEDGDLVRDVFAAGVTF